MGSKHENSQNHFQKIAQSETKCWPNIRWLGEIDNCDICSRPMYEEKFMIDGPAATSPDAPWGNLCVVCAYKFAPQIGWGSAQLYQKTPEGEWALISGGPPEEIDQ